ncbi:MAG: hypothetical protein V2I27_08625 [Erythrobacter sp.]|jgi:hypothetical protein|nr:hypothetical protein [Erythrobacter sp.]
MSGYKDPSEEDIAYGDRRISRPDASLPDWEMPDTAYRPIPIVWFTGAFLIHLVCVLLALALLGSLGAWIVVPVVALGAGAVAAWTWERGMKSAGTGWKLATLAFLGINILFALAATA